MTHSPTTVHTTQPITINVNTTLQQIIVEMEHPVANHHFFLVGGLEHFLFSHILGILIPIDFHIFQRGSNHQPVFHETKHVQLPEAESGQFSANRLSHHNERHL